MDRTGGRPSWERQSEILLGRGSECAVLEELMAAIGRGESRSLVIEGEAGIGKSALLAHLMARASAATLLRAAGVESEMELAFSTLHQLCGTRLDRLAALPAPQAQALEVVHDERPIVQPHRREQRVVGPERAVGRDVGQPGAVQGLEHALSGGAALGEQHRLGVPGP